MSTPAQARDDPASHGRRFLDLVAMRESPVPEARFAIHPHLVTRRPRPAAVGWSGSSSSDSGGPSRSRRPDPIGRAGPRFGVLLLPDAAEIVAWTVRTSPKPAAPERLQGLCSLVFRTGPRLGALALLRPRPPFRQYDDRDRLP